MVEELYTRYPTSFCFDKRTRCRPKAIRLLIVLSVHFSPLNSFFEWYSEPLYYNQEEPQTIYRCSPYLRMCRALTLENTCICACLRCSAPNLCSLLFPPLVIVLHLRRLISQPTFSLCFAPYVFFFCDGLKTRLSFPAPCFRPSFSCLS